MCELVVHSDPFMIFGYDIFLSRSEDTTTYFNIPQSIKFLSSNLLRSHAIREIVANANTDTWPGKYGRKPVSGKRILLRKITTLKVPPLPSAK